MSYSWIVTRAQCLSSVYANTLSKSPKCKVGSQTFKTARRHPGSWHCQWLFLWSNWAPLGWWGLTWWAGWDRQWKLTFHNEFRHHPTKFRNSLFRIKFQRFRFETWDPISPPNSKFMKRSCWKFFKCHNALTIFAYKDYWNGTRSDTILQL
jgi:hypothetical protein